MKLSILLLCGLPGAGKTTAAVKLKDLSPAGYKFVHICYDDLIKFVDHSNNLKIWKETRSQIVHFVNFLISHLGNHEESVKTFFKSCSQEYIDLPKLESICREFCNVSRCDRIIIIIDDNMQYRGMRFEYYKICRQYSIGFSIAYFDIHVRKCLQNNACRSRPLDDDVIKKLDVQMEVPGLSKSNWEQYVCTLGPHDITNSEVLLYKVLDIVNRSIENPPVVLQVVEHAASEAARRESRESFLHQADICMRKFVSTQMTHFKNGVNPVDLNSASRKLMAAKKAVSSYLKMGYVDESIFVDESNVLDLNALEAKIVSLMSSEIS